MIWNAVVRVKSSMSAMLLVHRHVVAGGQPAQVAADEVRPRVGQRGGRGRHVIGQVCGAGRVGGW
jgi:hypothetical protein